MKNSQCLALGVLRFGLGSFVVCLFIYLFVPCVYLITGPKSEEQKLGTRQDHDDLGSLDVENHLSEGSGFFSMGQGREVGACPPVSLDC